MLMFMYLNVFYWIFFLCKILSSTRSSVLHSFSSWHHVSNSQVSQEAGWGEGWLGICKLKHSQNFKPTNISLSNFFRSQNPLNPPSKLLEITRVMTANYYMRYLVVSSPLVAAASVSAVSRNLRAWLNIQNLDLPLGPSPRNSWPSGAPHLPQLTWQAGTATIASSTVDINTIARNII